MAQHHPLPSSEVRPRCESYPKPTQHHYLRRIHPSSIFLRLLAGAILASSDSSLAQLAVWSTDPTRTTQTPYCRYECLHDPPSHRAAMLPTHQWPYCPLRLLSNLLSIETRCTNSILGGNNRNLMGKIFSSSQSPDLLSCARAFVK